ncbi:MAG TPA: glycosyltransferase [Spirochaetota bacterium]|nr:glycosyltransferase [Spirochaetota bacterium]HOL55953.1 glycosyltransferase [Spirochaetota bacterium]
MVKSLKNISTLKNIKTTLPITDENNLVCGKYFFINKTNDSIDGGLRKEGKYKKSYNGKPLITICTIVYNNKDYIERTISSVLRQTYDNIEYIIIDGKSTDGTVDIIKKYENSIDYFISEKDNGIYDAMNKGLSLSTGDYILMLNSGDYLANRDIIKKVVKKIIKNDFPHIIYGKVYYFDEKTKKKFVNWDAMRDYHLFKNNSSLPHKATFVSSKVYNIIGGYDVDLKVGSDAIFTYYAKLYNFNFKFIDLIVSYYQIGGHSSKKEYLIEIYGFLYLKGLWDINKFQEKVFETYKIKSENGLKNFYEENKKIINKYNLGNIVLNLHQKNKMDILIMSDDLANHFNKNLANILSLLGFKVEISGLSFFLLKKYSLIILEWEDCLLNDRFFPEYNTYQDKVNHIDKILDYYKKNNTKIISIIHNKIEHEYIFDEEKSKRNFEFKRFIYQKSDAIIHLGYNGMKECIDFFDLGNKKNYVIPHSLYVNYNIKYNKNDSKKAIGLNKDDIVIGCFGAIRHQEEYDLIIKTFNNLDIKNKKLLLVGNHRKKINFLKRKDCIIVKEFLDDDQFAIYLNAVDIIFLPRQYSLNSGVLFLALSYSKVIVGPDVGNIGEYLKMFNYPTYKTEEDASESLEKGYELYISDPDIVYRNRIKAENEFSNYNLSMKFQEILKDIGLNSDTGEDELKLNEIATYNFNNFNKLFDEIDDLKSKIEQIRNNPESLSLKSLLKGVFKKSLIIIIKIIKYPFKLIKKII